MMNRDDDRRWQQGISAVLAAVGLMLCAGGTAFAANIVKPNTVDLTTYASGGPGAGLAASELPDTTAEKADTDSNASGIRQQISLSALGLPSADSKANAAAVQQANDAAEQTNAAAVQQANAAAEQTNAAAVQQANAAAEQTLNSLAKRAEALLPKTHTVEEYFRDSVLVGDSVAAGFGFYIQANQEHPILKNIYPLTSSGYAVYRALDYENELQPLYRGNAHYPVWKQIAERKAKHVFLFFGINDAGRTDFYTNYEKLIGRILEADPAADITIISATYLYPGADGKSRPSLNNAAIREMNARMQQMAEEKGWGYLNIADRLAGPDGYLDPKYCTDQELHQNHAAYEVWTEALSDYGRKKLQGK